MAPHKLTALAVAANVKEGTITSSPCCIPAASKPRCKAEVPEFTAIQWWLETVLENSSSNAATSDPCASMPLSRTRRTAAFSAPLKIGFDSGITVPIVQFSRRKWWLIEENTSQFYSFSSLIYDVIYTVKEVIVYCHFLMTDRNKF